MRVVLTRAEGRNAELARLLEEAGLEVAACPLVAVEPVPGPPVRTTGYDWLVLTSRTAVAHLFARLEGPLPPVAVVGAGTAAALRERGVEPALIASRSTQEGLLEDLPRPAGRVLFAAAEGARDLLPAELAADTVPLYRTIELRPADFPDGDLVVLASASAARALARIRSDLPCVSIGPVTSAEARRCGLDVVAEAERHDLDGLVAAVKLAASPGRSSPS